METWDKLKLELPNSRVSPASQSTRHQNVLGIRMQFHRNTEKQRRLIPEDWRAAYRQFIKISYSLYSLPFSWIEWVDGGRVIVTRNKYRLRLIFFILTTSSLDSIYRALVCVYVDKETFTGQQMMQMYSEFISRAGCTIVGWAIVLGREDFAGLFNNLLKEDDKLKSNSEQNNDFSEKYEY